MCEGEGVVEGVGDDDSEEVLVVFSANAVVEVLAVMIEVFSAAIAPITVIAVFVNPCITDGTVL